MFKSAIRAAPRRVLPPRSAINTSRGRFLSTAPPTRQSRSWKSSAARWGLAVGGIYYYNTSNVFAEEPEGWLEEFRRLDESIHHVQDSNQPTVDAIVEEKRQRVAQRIAEEQRRQQTAEEALKEGDHRGEEEGEGEGGLEGLEEEAGQEGAFNPETGEINWDCPCLGGMAHGPCGEEFKAAFSCFVHSNEEPKGVECIDKFQGMQNCFRQHPEMYGPELEDDEDEVEEELRAREAGTASGDEDPQSNQKQSPEAVEEEPQPIEHNDPAPESAPGSAKSPTIETLKSEKSEDDDLLPKAAHDATSN
ncbi:Mitochondrial intermembrane space import and assembly protein [Lachnellula suecica]|uniref:Mitochondrial intermembrane space import and assembly protein 40 n=1 Tax=Lachnellula suecica TaxID=602035 RepID=A0A8T9CK31_9HELO|nr:Mitochondrial intermembrane space import and assembly protein [Lachnellula suecica]